MCISYFVSTADLEYDYYYNVTEFESHSILFRMCVFKSGPINDIIFDVDK